jgi:NADH:ubiquinone oxidoreductase subunit 6 (subunit J)
MQMNVIFILFSVLIIASALFVLWSKNVVHSAFVLFFAFFGVAAIFVFANADFLAVAQIMIYIGGILILLVFGVLLTNKPNIAKTGQNHSIETNSYNRILGALITIGVFGVLFFMINNINFARFEGQNYEVFEAQHSSVKSIGLNLITENSLPFEAIALLLFGALIGAGYIAKSTLNNDSKLNK